MNSEEALIRMREGKIYEPGDPAIVAEQTICLEKQYDYNATRPSETQKRFEMLCDMFEEFGDGSYIEPPLHANFGGKHVRFGKNVYANFNLTLVDDGNIYVGNCCKFGPNVIIVTGSHPIEPHLRSKAMQFNVDVHIGNNVWIGAGSIVMPGVSIGDNSVIGAGSVVTHDIPSGVVAVGSPCKVLREIGEKDRMFYFKDRKIDIPIE